VVKAKVFTKALVSLSAFENMFQNVIALGFRNVFKVVVTYFSVKMGDKKDIRRGKENKFKSATDPSGLGWDKHLGGYTPAPKTRNYSFLSPYAKFFEADREKPPNRNKSDLKWAVKTYLERAEEDENDFKRGSMKKYPAEIAGQYEHVAYLESESRLYRDAAKHLTKAAKYYAIAGKGGKLTGMNEKEAKELASAFRHEAAKRKIKGLEHRVAMAVFLIIGAVGLFFLSPNITGNVIGNNSINSSNLIGAILFLIGIVGLFFTFKRNK